MGHTPIVRVELPPDRESFHLGRAKAAYVRGDITLKRLEDLAAHVLAGGYLSENLEPCDIDLPRDPSNRSTR